MDSMPMVDVSKVEKQRMAIALDRLFVLGPPDRPDVARWDWDDARFLLQRLKSPGSGEYDARARRLLERLGVWAQRR
jgi:hypothetical protein